MCWALSVGLCGCVTRQSNVLGLVWLCGCVTRQSNVLGLVWLCGCVTVSLMRWALWSCDRQSDALGFVVM